MEYGVKLCNEDIDYGNIKYALYQNNRECSKRFFSDETVRLISRKVTELTMGVDPQNRPIVVPDKNIIHVMNAIYDNFRPAVGDIHSRYIVPTGNTSQDEIVNMIDQVIEVITSNIRTSLEMEEHNRSLTAWTTVLGDFNQHGLRSHPQIKIRKRRPAPMQFNMNY